jgi:tRNA A-37 threonylcarbamoyl transferase component Bud32
MRPLLAASGLRAYADFVNCDMGDVVGQSGTTLTRRIELRADGACVAIFLKRYQYQGDRWRHRFRRHKGRVEADNLALMRGCGVPTPDVVAYGGRRRGMRLLDAFLITRGVPGAATLAALVEGDSLPEWAALIRDQGGHGPPYMALTRRMAELLAGMHARHVYHHDLQWRNVLVAPRGDGFELYFIDSSRGGLRRTPPGRRHGRVRDLASLDKLAAVHLSRADRLRFVRLYLGAKRLGAAGRELVESVRAYVERKR